jgi:hypothetical protein
MEPIHGVVDHGRRVVGRVDHTTQPQLCNKRLTMPDEKPQAQRGRRIPASEAKRPGWYRARDGSRIKLLTEPLKAHRTQPAAGYIPYLSPANPRSKDVLSRARLLGWLNPTYLVLPVRTKGTKP